MERLSVIPFALYLSFSATPAIGESLIENRGIKFFNVVPGNCIVKSAEPCEVSFQFSWALMKHEDACIFMEGQPDAIYCKHAEAGDIILDLAVDQSQQFTIMLTEAPQYKKSRRVKVLAIGEDVRIKRRHLWSFL